jgi:hypothetical protein
MQCIAQRWRVPLHTVSCACKCFSQWLRLNHLVCACNFLSKGPCCAVQHTLLYLTHAAPLH